MSTVTKIEWCDHTFNPWIGCTKVSPACDHCYAEALARRYNWAPWGPGEERRLTSETTWRQPLAWNRAAQRAGVRRRVFCASLADIFDAEVPDVWRGELFADVIDKTPHLDWLLLTKRPQVAAKWFAEEPAPANVWLGTTVEDQKMAELRIPILLSIQVTKRFLSCEPLLGPIDLTALCTGHYFIDSLVGVRYHDSPDGTPTEPTFGDIDWVIAGGESGPKTRPPHPDWFRSLRDQCRGAQVPFFFKQWGEWLPRIDRDKADPDWRLDYAVQNREPRTYQHLNLAGGQGFHGERVHLMKRVGKAAAGAMLDGREWREFPT